MHAHVTVRDDLYVRMFIAATVPDYSGLKAQKQYLVRSDLRSKMSPEEASYCWSADDVEGWRSDGGHRRARWQIVTVDG
jgi:hypothetical protein